MSDDWAWWAGRNEYQFGIGPCPTKDDAIKEALAQLECDEIETKDGWRKLIFYAECRGLHYDCDECGIVSEACQECIDYLEPEETAGTFSQTRNAGSVLLEYED